MELQLADWDRIRIFRVVAESGSIRAASGSLKVSEAKVSRDIEELEKTLGQELFLRSPKGMELTGIGSVVLRSARQMAYSADVISHVTDASTDFDEPVTIAAHEGIAAYWLARRMPEFHRANPRIKIIFKVVSDTPNLANGDADISIQFEQPTTPNVITGPLGWLHYVPFATPAYYAIHGTPTNMFDLGKHRVLLHTGYDKQVEAWAEKMPAWKEVMPHVLKSNSSTMLLEYCVNDGGVMAMPTYVGEAEPRLQAAPDFKPLASIRIWLAYNERMKGLARSEPVLNWLRACFDGERHPCFRESYVAPRSAALLA